MMPSWQPLCSTVPSSCVAMNKDKGQGCNVKAARLSRDSHYKWVIATQTILPLSTPTRPSSWNGSSWSLGMKIRERHDPRAAWKDFWKLCYSLVNNSLPSWTQRQRGEDKEAVGEREGAGSAWQICSSPRRQAEGRLTKTLNAQGIALATPKSLVYK